MNKGFFSIPVLVLLIVMAIGAGVLSYNYLSNQNSMPTEGIPSSTPTPSLVNSAPPITNISSTASSTSNKSSTVKIMPRQTEIPWVDAQILVSECQASYLSLNLDENGNVLNGSYIILKKGQTLHISENPSYQEMSRVALAASSTCGSIKVGAVIADYPSP